MRGTQVSGAGISQLGSPTVTALHLTDTKVTDSDLRSMPWMPQLKVLKLNRLDVGDSAADVVTRYPRIEHLEIDGTKISADGLRRIVHENPTLSRIEMRSTSVPANVIEELKSAYPNVAFVVQ